MRVKVIKTNLPEPVAKVQVIHRRRRQLDEQKEVAHSLVELAFYGIGFVMGIGNMIGRSRNEKTKSASR